MKILIAEDSDTSLLQLEKLVKDMGYEAISCKDGLEAWEIMKSDNAPNLLILDWMMPGMDGGENFAIGKRMVNFTGKMR